MWTQLLDRMLTTSIQAGRLAVTFPDGSRRVYGAKEGLEAEVFLKDQAIIPRLLVNPDLALGEGYMEGKIDFPSDDDLRGFLRIAAHNAYDGHLPWPIQAWQKVRMQFRHVMQWNSLGGASKKVRHHYDIQDDFYELFLDERMQYSCAYFREPDYTLEEAQIAKMDHIAGKLLLEPGMRVLDIGCGWGGLSRHLAMNYGVHVTGITLSPVQLARAQLEAEKMGIADRVTFKLLDYRLNQDQYDRVVSVGMMEHVGVPNFQDYFNAVKNALKPDGVGLIHYIGRYDPPSVLSPWFQKYIFPGGYCPALSEVMPAVENAPLVVTDIEVWRGHYERTLRQWQYRFRDKDQTVRKMFDDRFIRMWMWYLVASEVSFTDYGMEIFHLQVSHHQDAVPMTRDYLYNKNR